MLNVSSTRIDVKKVNCSCQQLYYVLWAGNQRLRCQDT